MVEGLNPYVAFAVDALGVARATYEFTSHGDEEAKKRAEAYLDAHEVIELWTDHRLVERMMCTNRQIDAL
ncbi:hypothetical protein [Bradyrhizobium erythrophlei]|uniref:Uncharacterized protein n=1 Tax=Bradyrhizobium erythrophlei TaxID=1437360 RepID=A0A1H4XYQ5_9BRAD|nr:hypothetical protein [Bradyrhizobium erythrophlei]SED10595.1 hypothetical protein SAMN05444164_3709 [Bradyrhizobium erythrophlei]